MCKHKLQKLIILCVISFTISTSLFAGYSKNIENSVNKKSISFDELSSFKEILYNSKPIKFIGSSNQIKYTPRDFYAQYALYIINHKNNNCKYAKILTYMSYRSYANLYSDIIPNQYLYAMLNESLKQNVPLYYIYGISRRETVNFQYFSSLKPNSNGSIDIGLMGINSQNIDITSNYGKNFLNSFFYYDDEYDLFNPNNQLHILKIGTSYLKNLLDSTNSFKSACICYNGGYGRWYNRRPPRESVLYSKYVSKFANFAAYRFNKLNLSYIYLDNKTIMYINTYLSINKKSITFKKINVINSYIRRYMKNLDPNSYKTDNRKWVCKEEISNIGVYLGTLSEDGSYLIFS